MVMQWNGMGMQRNGMGCNGMEWVCENRGKRVSALIAAACP